MKTASQILVPMTVGFMLTAFCIIPLVSPWVGIEAFYLSFISYFGFISFVCGFAAGREVDLARMDKGPDDVC